MSDGISLDVGSALPYVVDRVATLFGKGAESIAWRIRLTRMTKMAAEHAYEVQCVGMPRPVPITDIYQPRRILVPRNSEPYSRLEMTIDQVLDAGDSVITAGPGRGKTTLLHWTYTQLCKSERWVPLLFTLRWPEAASDLSDFVEALHAGRPLHLNKK